MNALKHTPSCATVDLEHDAKDLGWVELMRLTARLLHERSMSRDVARMLAGELAVWAGGGLDTADRRKTRARIADLERYESCPAAPCCPRCGQLSSAVDVVCDACRRLERAPQGERMSLFTPAPAVLRGQEGMF